MMQTNGRGERMERIRFMTHRGARVLLLDMTGLTDFDEELRHIEAAKPVIAREPAKSLLLLTDVTGSRYNAAVMGAMKEMGAHNTPYVKASAVVTQAAAHRVAVTTVSLFTKRIVKAFATRDEALDWLVAQA
jgi:hypothetical protein